MNSLLKISKFAIILALLGFISPSNRKTTIYLIGDSTMCDYPPDRAPINGWGMPFKYFFDSTITIDNRAKGGRSTRTFLSEDRWQPIAGQLNEGDYVFIQFGHNDEAREEKYKDRYTSVPDYKINLAKFINETRAKKAIPVLLTPVTRMKFDKDGNIMETHTEYTAAVYAIAAEYKVELIDLDKMSRDLLQQFGPANAGLLFMQLKPGEHPNYPDGQKDNTHFNEYGARRIAELVLTGIRSSRLDLVNHIIIPDKKK